MSTYTIGMKDDKISSMMQRNKELLEEEHFKDVTLVSDDLHIMRAHKAMLSNASDIFKKILMLKEEKDPIIFIRGASPNHLKSLLEFVYVGETEVTEKDMNAFVQLARAFKIKEFDDKPKPSDLINISAEKANNVEKFGNGNEVKIQEEYPLMTEKEFILNQEDGKNETEDLFYEENWTENVFDEGSSYNPGKKNEDEEVHKMEGSNEDALMLEKNRKVKEECQSYVGVKCRNLGCTKVFTKYQNMKVHYKVTHEGFSLKCEVCGYKTTRANTLRKHKQNHHE